MTPLEARSSSARSASNCSIRTSCSLQCQATVALDSVRHAIQELAFSVVLPQQPGSVQQQQSLPMLATRSFFWVTIYRLDQTAPLQPKPGGSDAWEPRLEDEQAEGIYSAAEHASLQLPARSAILSLLHGAAIIVVDI